jgi:Tfp pilus assembly protein PilV
MKNSSLNPIKNQGGFTMIETCAAMIVMFIAVLGSLSVFTLCIRNNSGANDRELAMAVGQQKLEQLRSVSFTDSILDQTSTQGVTTTITKNGRQYSLNTKIVHSNTINGKPTLKTITIVVTPKGQNMLGSVVLTTVRSTNLAGPNRF